MRIEIKELIHQYYPKDLETWESDYISSEKLIERTKVIQASKQLYRERFENLSLYLIQLGFFKNPMNLTNFGNNDVSFGLILGASIIPSEFKELNHIIFVSLLGKYYCFFHRVKELSNSSKPNILYFNDVHDTLHSNTIRNSIHKYFHEFIEFPYPASREILNVIVTT